MANRFLEFYNDELRALRLRATRFAEAYPKIAGRLRLAHDTSDDPHVERLIQSFAFSAARVRQKLDDSLPELSDALLETLYPHYLAPLPAMSVVSFTPAPDLDGCRVVPRGTQIKSEPIDGDTVRFSTSQDVAIAPIKIDSISMMSHPFDAPVSPYAASATACLRITLAPLGKAKLNELELGPQRFFIAAPSSEANPLLAMLMQNVMGVTIAANSAGLNARHRPATALKTAEHTDDEALLPYPEGSFLGYRALTEFFALPDKFFFFDLDPGEVTEEERLDFYVYFDRLPDGLDKTLGSASLTLHATPIVNLFASRAETITLDGTRNRYPLSADARRHRTRVVHSVRSVTLTDSSGQVEKTVPYFHRHAARGGKGVYWQFSRPVLVTEGVAETETRLSFVDGRDRRLTRPDATASAEIVVTNGDLPRKLPYGGGQPRLTSSESLEPVTAISCMRPMSPNSDAVVPRDRAWQLISHLSLNHLTLTANGTPVLKNILRLYDPGHTRQTAQMIDAIDSLQATPALTRIGSVMVSGTDIELTFDDQRIDAGLAVVFGSVIDRFLGCYTTINTFTRLTLRMKNRTDILARFAPRAGEEALI